MTFVGSENSDEPRRAPHIDEDELNAVSGKEKKSCNIDHFPDRSRYTCDFYTGKSLRNILVKTRGYVMTEFLLTYVDDNFFNFLFNILYNGNTFLGDSRELTYYFPNISKRFLLQSFFFSFSRASCRGQQGILPEPRRQKQRNQQEQKQ